MYIGIMLGGFLGTQRYSVSFASCMYIVPDLSFYQMNEMKSLCWL